MRIASEEYTRKRCPDCKVRGAISRLKKIVQEWNPFQDSGNNFYEIHVLICPNGCGYASVTKNELESFRKVPYRLAPQSVEMGHD